MEKYPRLFWAFDLPPVIERAVKDVQDGLRSRFPHLKWVKAGNIHITLHFLGDTDPRQIPEMIEALQPCLALQPPIPVSLGPLGAFPGWSAPRVLWLALQGNLSPLYFVHEKTGTVLQNLGLNLENRPFSPHITIARVPEGTKEAGDLPNLKLYTKYEKPAAGISALTLYASELKPGGAVYTRRHTFALEL